MDTDIFFLVFFFTLILVYGMTGNKRPFSASSDRRPRNLTEREGEATNSHKRPRGETAEVVESTYIFLPLFKKRINISY